MNSTRFFKSAFAVIIAAVAFTACSPTTDTPIGTGDPGTITTAGTPIRYVALGNSLTAGYQSGAVVWKDVDIAYPVLMAQSMGIAIGDGADQFQYMRFASGQGIGTRQILVPAGASFTLGTPQSFGSAPSNATLARPYNNLGVPGAVLADMHPPTTGVEAQLAAARMSAARNPFFGAVMRNPAFGRTLVDQGAALNPNFVTIFIGNNDVLGYSTSGGTSGTNVQFLTTGQNPTPTESARFASQFNTLVDTVMRRMPNAKVLIGNIPNVLFAPYFQARPLIQGALPANFPLQENGRPTLNGLVVRSSLSPGGLRRITSADLILLPALSAFPQLLATGAGTSLANPLPDNLVLDSLEINVVRASTNDFNAAIAGAVARYQSPKRAALFDANATLADVAARGYFMPGLGSSITVAFISGGFFSLDGVHPSARGYGAIATEMLRATNREFGSNFPFIDIRNLPAIPLGTP
jgi:lysophospholipase L1-like esterase